MKNILANSTLGFFFIISDVICKKFLDRTSTFQMWFLFILFFLNFI